MLFVNTWIGCNGLVTMHRNQLRPFVSFSIRCCVCASDFYQWRNSSGK